MFVTSYSITYCIYIPGKPGFCFHYYCAVYDECKKSDTFWLADRVRLSVHHTISLLSLCKLIWRHRTYKMPVRYISSSVWVRWSIFCQLSIIQYMGLSVFNLPISLLVIERIYSLSYYHHQIGSMNYYPLFRQCHETTIYAVCLFIFCRIFKHNFWLSGGSSTKQSDARIEKLCYYTCILTRKWISYII